MDAARCCRDEAFRDGIRASQQRGGFDLRWFTPAVEVDLCGHATLATAHVLFETGRLAPEYDRKVPTAQR